MEMAREDLSDLPAPASDDDAHGVPKVTLTM
jgi:hypothetical protein